MQFLFVSMRLGHFSVGFQKGQSRQFFLFLLAATWSHSKDHSHPVLQDREHPLGVEGLDPVPLRNMQSYNGALGMCLAVLDFVSILQLVISTLFVAPEDLGHSVSGPSSMWQYLEWISCGPDQLWVAHFGANSKLQTFLDHCQTNLTAITSSFVAGWRHPQRQSLLLKYHGPFPAHCSCGKGHLLFLG